VQGEWMPTLSLNTKTNLLQTISSSQNYQWLDLRVDTPEWILAQGEQTQLSFFSVSYVLPKKNLALEFLVLMVEA